MSDIMCHSCVPMSFCGTIFKEVCDAMQEKLI